MIRIPHRALLSESKELLLQGIYWNDQRCLCEKDENDESGVNTLYFLQKLSSFAETKWKLKGEF